jgi:hypothetical protein
MKKILLIVIGALLCGNLAAQTILTPHFTEQSVKIVIPKDAIVFKEIHENMIALYNNGKIHYVNLKGEYIFGTNFPFTRGIDFYRSAYFSGGAMMACRENTKGYGKIPFIIYPDGKYRDFPTGAKTSYGSSFDVFDAFSFCEGYALVKKGELINFTACYIDKNGKEVFPLLSSKSDVMRSESQIYPLRENRRLYFNFDVGKYGYADDKGNIVIKPQFDKAENFNDGMALVMVKENYTEKWGYIDLTGKLVIPATYKLRPGRFSEGLAAVKIGESPYDYEMAYIDKTGKRVMDRQPWLLNEFHDGYAWVKKDDGEKLVVINKKFEEVRDVTNDFYHHGNGFGVMLFTMKEDKEERWGFDFPNGMQTLNQKGVTPGDIFAPDGTMLYKCMDKRENDVVLHSINKDGLMYCEVRMRDEPRLKSKDIILPCFINTKGEIVYYFIEDVEGYEGIAPIQIK